MYYYIENGKPVNNKFLYLKKLDIPQKFNKKNIPPKYIYIKKKWFLNKKKGDYLLEFI
tara:strand:- start:870 stop:1043 length:174 start_codon:yes stop_codon:yes gene_type:complete